MQEQNTNSIDLESLARLFTIPRETLRSFVQLMVDGVFNTRVDGLENIPKKGGAVLVCNHADYMDVIIMGLNGPRNLIFMGKAELFETHKEMKSFLFQDGSPLNLPFISLVRPALETLLETTSLAQKVQLEEMGVRPISRNFRGSTAKDAVRYYQDLENQMQKIVEAGDILVIYPEGTRTRTGVIGPFKAMAAKIALRAKVPLIPAGLNGTFNFSTVGNFIKGGFLEKTMGYNIGQPIFPQDFPEGNEKKASKILTSMLEEQVNALTQHAERRAHPRQNIKVL